MTTTPDSRGGPAITVKPKATPGTSAWKTMTANRWHTNHPYAGQPGVDPKTGQPVMKSQHEIRAEANANTWKAIAAMQASLPSQTSVDAPFQAQSAAIDPLVAAHRSWLEQAGHYQVEMANKLGAQAGETVHNADAVQGGLAGAAGAPVGTAPTTNVTPDQAGVPEAYGSNFGSYLSTLLPAATAQGIGNKGLINSAQQAADQKLFDARAAITGQVPKLFQDAYDSAHTNATDDYKSELAALVAGGKSSTAAATLKETRRYHTGLLAAADDRNGIARSRAEAAITKANNAGTARTAGDASGLRAALAAADLYMHPKAGAGKTTKVPTRYGVTLVTPATEDALHNPVAGKSKVIAGATLEDVQKSMKWFLKHNKNAGWQPAKSGLGYVHPLPGFTETKTTPGAAAGGDAYARRQHAWGMLVAANNASLHPVDKASLLAYFRAMEGSPT